MFKKYAVTVCRLFAMLYLVIFFCWSSGKLVACQHPSGIFLQLAVIVGLFFGRLRRRTSFYFLPDQMLVCLPYFWSLANAGSAAPWFDTWKISLFAVFAMSMLNLTLQKSAFPGGLRSNTLMQSLLCSVLFVWVFVSAMSIYFSSFPVDLYRATMMNLIVAVAGIPVSIAAFYQLVARGEAGEA